MLAGIAPAFADSQNVGVDGQVIAPLVLTVDRGLTLPDVVMPTTGTTTVTLNQAGVTSYGSGGSPGATNDRVNTAEVAELTAAGEDDYTFAISAPTASLGTGLSFAPSCPATGTVDEQFVCGGTLTVSTTASPGALSSATFAVTVTYN